MKRLLTVLVAVGCWMGLTAQVITQTPIIPGNTDAVTLLYYASQGNAALKSYTGTYLYSHMGLLTSESTDVTDVKYKTSVYELGDQAEPRWSRTSSGSTIWKYTISNLYDFFNCPTTADITGIAIIMHDGKGSSSTLGLDKHEKVMFVPVQRTSDCTYTVLMDDAGSNGWENGGLYIFGNGFLSLCEMTSGGQKALSLSSYGTGQTLYYVFGNNDSEVSYSIVGKGGKVLHSHQTGESFSMETTLSDDVCGNEGGDYTIKNLRYEADPENPNGYIFKWDKNPKIPYYELVIYKSNGSIMKSDFTEGDEIHVALNTETSDNCRAAVYGARGWYTDIFGGGTWIDFPFELKPMGQTTVRMLIPSDSPFDTDKGVYFAWNYGSESGEAEMKQEGDSHWWSAQTNITTPIYEFEIYSPTGEKTRDVATAYGQYLKNKICEEIGGENSQSEVDGILCSFHDRRSVSCETKDHNYTIASSEASYEDGLATFTWEIVADDATYYRFILYDDKDNELASNDVYGKSYSFRNTGKDPVTVSHWTIQPYVMIEAGYPVKMGAEYKGEKTFQMENPYYPRNIQASKGEENRYIISWDAYDKATKYRVYCTAQKPSYILFATFTVGKEIRKVGDRFQITTNPIITSGKCVVTIQAEDKEGYVISNAKYEFDAVTENLGTVKISVLVPEDCCYDVSKGVYFRWKSKSDAEKTLQATKDKDSHWYRAEITVNATCFDLTVNNQPAATWASGYTMNKTDVTGKNPMYYVYDSNTNWFLGQASADTKDHNYIPQDVAITPLPDEGALQISVTAIDPAYKYEVALYKKSSSSLYKTFSFYSKENETSTITRVVYPQATSEVEINKVIVTAYDSHEKAYCRTLEKSLAFTVPLNALFPSGLTVEEHDNRTVTLSWDAKTGVRDYTANMYFNGSLLENQKIRTDEIYPVGGKYSVTFTNLAQNGDYTFTVYGFAWEDDYSIGTQTVYATIAKQPAYDQDVTIRVLIPTDNTSMDISSGVWFCYWLHGQSMKTQGKFVKATVKDHWYEATIKPGAPFYYVVQNKGNWSGSYSNSHDSKLIKTTEVCAELTYRTWNLAEVACDAPDHDYGITSVDVDYSKAGRATFTIKPKKDIAPMYYISYRKKGSSDLFEWFGTSEKGSTTISNPITRTVNDEYEFRVYPKDSYGDDIANYFTGYTLITGNPNIPTDLKTELGADDKTVTFSWKANGTETAYYGIWAYDYAGYEKRLDVTNIEGTEYTAALSIYSVHYWCLTAYDKDGNVLAYVYGPDFAVKAPNMTPYDLNHCVNGNRMTLEWSAPDGAPMCYYVVYDSNDGTILTEDYITGTDGLYRLNIAFRESVRKKFSWQVKAVSEDKTDLSAFVYGDDFMIQGSTSSSMSAQSYTLTIAAGIGGYVNSAANGQWAEGKTVAIKAYQYPNWNFVEWSDGNKNAQRVITMDKDYTLVALFSTSLNFQLTLKAGEHGKVNEEVNGSYAGGNAVDIIATPDYGYKFLIWSDGSAKATRTILMEQDKTLKAYFVPMNSYTLSVLVEPEGGGSVFFDGTKEESNTKKYLEGATVTVSVQPATGYTFDHLEDGGATINENVHVVHMNGNKTIKAFFKKAEGIETVESQKSKVESRKFIRDGQLYIMYNGTIYDVQGRKVKGEN